MSQFPFDEFSKDLLKTLLQPIGEPEDSKTIPSEVREIDLYFMPHRFHPTYPELGLLQKLVHKPTSLEVFRNAATVPEIKSCMSKLWDMQHSLAKAAKKKKQTISPEQQPQLWIITPTLSVQQLQKLAAKANLEICSRGIYQMAPALDTGIVIIHQLPVTPDTLWLRIMGRDKVQLEAAKEIAALPLNHPYRVDALKLLANLKVQLEAKKRPSSSEKQLIMNLSPVFLEQLNNAEKRGVQIGEQIGEAKMVLKRLIRHLGAISESLEQQIKNLDSDRLESLDEILLNFQTTAELVAWLEQL